MKTNRREFLKAAGAFGAFNLIPARVLWGATAPSNQLTRALIGFSHQMSLPAFAAITLWTPCQCGGVQM